MRQIFGLLSGVFVWIRIAYAMLYLEVTQIDDFYLLNQAPGDRDILCEKLHISPEQAKYITYAEAGEGLIILPFVDKFPTDTKLYSIMATRLEEVATI